MVKPTFKVKQFSEKDLLKKGQKSIEAILYDIPFIELRKTKANVRVNNKEVDFILDTLISGKPAKFIVEIKSQGEPRLVRMAIAQIKDYLQGLKD